ncbi:tRNA1(Val) (adenine(37)-N6)-methyltransferase [Reyranella sp.]|uniref:tRNA1(Val) (adenine(37)-N6)-methyltransferase n=1 Tax=Reyranella sp. TaxID=1929291 RepID=UPI003BA94B53
MERPLTEDALLGGRVRLLQPGRGYRVAIDAVLLAAAVDSRPGQRILDLGAGVGAVGLCIAARTPGCEIVGVEMQAELATLATKNAQLNGMSAHVHVVEHDIAHPLPAALGSFDHVATNPPYLAAAVADPSPDPSKALATVESTAPLARWLSVAVQALKPAGDLIVVHRSDRLDEATALLAALGWGDIAVKRLPPAARVLLRARRSEVLQRREVAPLTLHRPDGGFTDEAEAILRHAAPLAF